MSVEKLDFNIVRQESKTFTTHLNSVLQNLNNMAALGLWAYLSSLPDSWTVNKKHLMNHFKVGRDKLSKELRFLESHNLIEMGQERYPNGTVGNQYIIVKCGYNFTYSEPVTENPLTAQPFTEKPSPVKAAYGKSAPINKTNNINKNKKRESDIKIEKPLSVFKPDNQNQKLSNNLGLNLEEELKSFTNRHRGEKTQYEFERWMKASFDYKQKKNTNVSVSHHN